VSDSLKLNVEDALDGLHLVFKPFGLRERGFGVAVLPTRGLSEEFGNVELEHVDLHHFLLVKPFHTLPGLPETLPDRVLVLVFVGSQAVLFAFSPPA